MGRLFHYNRFNNEDTPSQKCVLPRNMDTKDKEMFRNTPRKFAIRAHDKTNKYESLICPAYADIFPERSENNVISSCSNSQLASQSNGSSSLKTTAKQPISTVASASSFLTVKSVEIAIKKYQQWSNKRTTTSQVLSGSEDTEAEDNSQLSCSSSSTSGCHSNRTSDDNSEMVTGTASSSSSLAKRPKVYDCMKDFLRRKLFQQQQPVAETNIPVKQQQNQEEEEDATSDFDEVDVLESSYNADDDDESFCCIEDSTDDEECLLTLTQDTVPTVTCGDRKGEASSSTGSLNCWQYDADCTDSDAGISDCCQLLSDKSPKCKQKSPKRKAYGEEQPELRDVPWFQPSISSKAATARLSKEPPGTFIIRQDGRATNSTFGLYELNLRLETKVKRYIIVCSARCYKLKGAKKEFSSLKALITHHSVMAEQLPVTLALPRPVDVTTSSQRYLDDFDTFESLQILGILKFLQSKNLEFS